MGKAHSTIRGLVCFIAIGGVQPAGAAEPHLEVLGSVEPKPFQIPIISRGECPSVFAGVCQPSENDGELTLQGDIDQTCDDGQWLALAFPVDTADAAIQSITITHNTNIGIGDLYLTADAGGCPDLDAILWTGGGVIAGHGSGMPTTYCTGSIGMAGPAWIVMVPRGDSAFGVAYDDDGSGGSHVGAGLVSLVSDPTCSGPDQWIDFAVFGVGFCYWVSVDVADGCGDCPEPIPDGCEPSGETCEGWVCDGDANGDGVVDPLDTGYVLSRFELDVCDECQADLNCDGVIDPLDSGYALSRFGTCAAPLVCELDCP